MKHKLPLSFAIFAAFAWQTSPSVEASTVLGIGTDFLLGNDLTDPENDGDPESDSGYDAVFTASEEASFGGGENAFNVFDNQVGGGNTKWCCGDGNNFPANPISIDADLGKSVVLTHFTLTSGNDSPLRDPRVWEIQGSNNGTTFTTIFAQDDPAASVWGNFNEVIRFDSGSDFTTPAAYSIFRFITTATGSTTGARFQLNEIEYFGRAIPEPGVAMLMLAGLATFAVSRRFRA